MLVSMSPTVSPPPSLPHVRPLWIYAFDPSSVAERGTDGSHRTLHGEGRRSLSSSQDQPRPRTCVNVRVRVRGRHRYSEVRIDDRAGCRTAPCHAACRSPHVPTEQSVPASSSPDSPVSPRPPEIECTKQSVSPNATLHPECHIIRSLSAAPPRPRAVLRALLA